MKKPIWQNHYVYYKYVDGLDREITLTVMITNDGELVWTDDYHKESRNIKISKKAMNDIIKGKISPFNCIETYKRNTKMSTQRDTSDRKTVWKKDNYEITKNKTSYRLRVFDETGELITGVGINKSSYKMIIDDIVHPSYYIERSI